MKKMVKDPVCGMDVDASKASYSIEYIGKTYYFCSELCMKRFEREPNRYAKV